MPDKKSRLVNLGIMGEIIVIKNMVEGVRLASFKLVSGAGCEMQP